MMIFGDDMSFLCPECSNKKSLQITSSIELSSDMRSDEIALQVVKCRDCGYEGLAVYEESSRGALDSESVDHYGYYIDQKVLRSTRSLMKRCPKPKDARCTCKSHQKLNQQDPSGRWIRPGYDPNQKTYRIIL